MGTQVTDPDPDLGLVKLEKELRHQMNRLKAEKEHRMEEVIQLKREDEDLCQSMDEEPMLISTTHIPTDAQMKALHAHIRDMKVRVWGRVRAWLGCTYMISITFHGQTLKNQRTAKFADMKLAVIDLMERLEAEPDSTFERTLVCENDAAFILSTQNLQMVQDMLRRLEDRMAANRDHAQRLREQIYSLIRKLGQEEAERQRVEIELGGHSPREIKEVSLTKKKDTVGLACAFDKVILIFQLQQILDELEVLKSEKMEQFIQATRQDLVELWDKCYYSQNQRDKFAPFFDTNYNDELLSVHEKEVERLKNYHEANRDLFQKVAKRQDLWKKMLELEAKQKDPGHLLKAKGNTLLLEERDRKRVNKQLPKIEQELMDEMAQFLEVHGRPFLVGGVSYEDFVENQVFEHNRLVEDEKQAKLEARKKQNFHETIYGSKPVTPAANRAGAKRKATGQTPVNDSKRYRPELATRSVSTLRSPYVRAPLSSSKKANSAHQSSRVSD